MEEGWFVQSRPLIVSAGDTVTRIALQPSTQPKQALFKCPSSRCSSKTEEINIDLCLSFERSPKIYVLTLADDNQGATNCYTPNKQMDFGSNIWYLYLMSQHFLPLSFHFMNEVVWVVPVPLVRIALNEIQMRVPWRTTSRWSLRMQMPWWNTHAGWIGLWQVQSHVCTT